MKPRRQASARARFRATLTRLKALREQQRRDAREEVGMFADRIREYTGWDIASDDAVLARADQRLQKWEVVALRRPHVDACARLYAESNAEISWLKTCLNRLAETAEVVPGDQWLVDFRSSPHTYRSQTQPDLYARASAEIRAEALRAKGLEVRCRVPDGPVREWVVEVAVSEPLDIAILERCPVLSLIDFVAGCWRRGANPRVFNPWIPHGFEARFGISYQGVVHPGGQTKKAR